MSEPFAQKKKSGLANASLILGIFGLICLGLFTGIPAIICGHIARGNIKREPLKYNGAGAALAGLILGYCSLVSTIVIAAILAALALPAIDGATQRGKASQELSNARQIQLAIQQMALDGKTTGDKSLGYPADAGITTVSELKARLIKGGYLSLKDADALHFDAFEIGNVSESDPAETTLLRLPLKPPARWWIVFYKGGDGSILLPRQQGDSHLDQAPPRDPAYLAP